MIDTKRAGRCISPPRGYAERLKAYVIASQASSLWFRSQRTIGALAGFVAAGVVGIVTLALLLLPFQYRQARQRWEQQRISHYQMEVTWAGGWSYGHALVEMRDNQLIKAVDLETGQPLDQNRLLTAGYFASVDNLFEIIDARMQPKWIWRNLLERASPALARQIDSCVAPLSDVGYDPQFGFPTKISYNDGWCAITFFDYSNVTITGFQRLP
jgi:hypothetical protein